MACQNSSNDCSSCSFRGIKDTVSVVWCLVCKECLCTNCREHHAAVNGLRSHELISIENRDKLPEVAVNINDTCFEHNRKFEMFCSDHQEACCLKCSTTTHGQCNKMSPLDEIIRDVKSSTAFNSIQDGVNALFSKLDNIIKLKKNSVGLFKRQANEIKKCVEDKRTDIVIMLQRLLEDVFSKVDRFEGIYCTETNEVLGKLNEQLRVIGSIKTDLLQIKEKGTELQIFLCLKKFEAMLSQAEDSMTFIIEKGELDSLDLSFIPHKELQNLTSLQEFGDVKSHKMAMDLTFGSLGQSVKNGEDTKLKQKDIDKITLKKKIEMTFQEGTLATNCVILDKLGNAMLFTDYTDKKRLILFDGNGIMLRTMDIESKPYDVTIVEGAVVAVTLPDVHKVIFVDFLSVTGIVRMHFNTSHQCFGITFSENRFAVSVKGYGIQLFNAEGMFLRTVPYVCQVLAFVKSNICYIQSGEKVLRCCNQYGEKQWEVTFPHNMYPSIAVDEFGLIYITDKVHNDVFVVASDGSCKYKKLLQQSDGLWNVTGAFFNVKTQQLLLCTKWLTNAVLYDVFEQ